jgi:hypothetical protein
MYSSKSYQLIKNEYNYLLPVLRNKLSYSNGKYYFVGSSDDLSDMLDRLKGLYDNYDELNRMITYECFKDGSLNQFRSKMGVLS